MHSRCSLDPGMAACASNDQRSGAGEVAPFRSLEVQEEKASDGKKKLVTGRNCTLARGESRRFVSRTAHEESRLPHSGARRFCYNRWMGWRMASIAVTDPLNKPKKSRKEMHKRCGVQLSTIPRSIR